MHPWGRDGTQLHNTSLDRFRDALGVVLFCYIQHVNAECLRSVRKKILVTTLQAQSQLVF